MDGDDVLVRVDGLLKDVHAHRAIEPSAVVRIVDIEENLASSEGEVGKRPVKVKEMHLDLIGDATAQLDVFLGVEVVGEDNARVPGDTPPGIRVGVEERIFFGGLAQKPGNFALAHAARELLVSMVFGCRPPCQVGIGDIR